MSAEIINAKNIHNNYAFVTLPIATVTGLCAMSVSVPCEISSTEHIIYIVRKVQISKLFVC